MKQEIYLLREIASAAKNAWDNEWIAQEGAHLKNLLNDYVDMKERREDDEG